MISPLSAFVKYQQIVGCITSVIQKSTENSSTVIQAGGNVDLNFPTILRNYEGGPARYLPRNSQFYLIHVDQMPVNRFVTISTKEIFFNPRARFLFIGEKFNSSDVRALIFDYLVNAIFLNTSTGNIYTYFPYELGNLQNTSNDLRNIGQCDASGFVQKEEYDSLFPEKIPKIWKNSSISLIYSYEPPLAIGTKEKKKGIEIDLFNIILDRIKIEGHYFLRNASITNVEPLLMEHNFDVFFGNVGSQRIGQYQFTVPYISDSAFWYVPQQPLIPKWKYVFKAFSTQVWLFWSLSVLFSSLFWYAVYIALENEANPDSLFEKPWIILRLFLEQSSKLKVKYVSQAISIFLILQSTFVLNIVYKGKYTYFLSGRNYEEQVNSVEDIMRNNLKMGTTVYLKSFFLSIPEMATYLQSHFVNCDTGLTCLNRSLFENMAVLKPHRKVSYIRHLFRDKNGHTLHHRIPKSVMPVWQAAMFSNGHPVFPLVNKYFHFLMDHGFLVKIIDRYDREVTKRRRPTSSRITKNPKFSFEYFVAPFFILASGNSLGLLVLLIEILMDKMRKKI